MMAQSTMVKNLTSHFKTYSPLPKKGPFTKSKEVIKLSSFFTISKVICLNFISGFKPMDSDEENHITEDQLMQIPDLLGQDELGTYDLIITSNNSGTCYVNYFNINFH